MALELIVNVLLLCGAIFSYWYVGATMPSSANNEMGAEQWPRFLLILLVIGIGFNLFNYFKKNKKTDIAASFADFLPGIIRLVKSKLFIGMAILVVMALLYEPLGFLAVCFLFMMSYGFLLGARRIVPLLIVSFVSMLVLYIVFGVLLGIMLPKGYVYFLREIAYFLEELLLRS